MKKFKQHGFTLIEIAIVFVILAVLLSYTFMPLRAQLESKNIKEARSKLIEIEESLYGFAIAKERLPCPTQPGQGGLEQFTPVVGAGNCTSSIGFIPSTTLGIKGEVNCDGLLMDPWGQPYRYSITSTDFSATGGEDFVVAGQLKSPANGGEGIGNVTPDIQVCNNLGSTCVYGSDATDISANDAVAVLFSIGTKQRANSTEENENAGEATVASQCGLPAYGISNDRFYYASTRREVVGNEFDDILIWISPNILYSTMLKAGIIP